jgi:DNA (cytosine-5)-methyltransferase 1
MGEPMKGEGGQEDRALNVAGLFAGIGGIEVGLARAGHRAVLLCESDPSAQEVLRARFSKPDGDLIIEDDVTKLTRLPSDTTMISAGFPCQNLSQAGRTEGMDGKASGLVRCIFRILREHTVPWVLIENVPFMLQLEGGRTLSYILSQLERLKYRWAYRIIDSRSLGLPQRRRRVFILAARSEDPRNVLLADDAGPPVDPEPPWGTVAYGFYWTEGWRGLGWAVDGIPPLKGGSGLGIPGPPAILLPDGRLVTPSICDAERLQGFEEDWTRPAELLGKGGRSRWKLVGNAVTVDVAAWIGKRLVEPGQFHDAAAPAARILSSDRWPTAAWNIGDGRFRASVSEWPQRIKSPALADFLRHPLPLSQRATRGFLSRLISSRATIRSRPAFVASLERHLTTFPAETAQ